MIAPPSPESLLPLPPAAFHILLSLAEDDRHGYAIIQDVAARTGGGVTLGAGTLYRTIQRMLEQDLIVEVDAPPSDSADERRRYYRATALGTAVLAAETERMTALLGAARAKRVRAR